MKKILISAYSMQIGGIETALVNLLKYLAKDERNDITLVLDKNEGVFLDEIPDGIHIEENYHPEEDGNTFIRKIKTGRGRSPCQIRLSFSAEALPPLGDKVLPVFLPRAGLFLVYHSRPACRHPAGPVFPENKTARIISVRYGGEGREKGAEN
ncbi:MAG: hypothetical protein IIY74_06820 [Firmicutes bacterium]|nr:hypothetical protein [Bacillota bacterium]